MIIHFEFLPFTLLSNTNLDLFKPIIFSINLEANEVHHFPNHIKIFTFLYSLNLKIQNLKVNILKPSDYLRVSNFDIKNGMKY